MARTKNRFNAVSAEYTVASDVIVPEKKYRVALYARLSVEKVSRPGNSIESQLDIMKAFISDHSEFQEFCEYTDNGYSGTNFERPEFNRMMDDVRSGKINCICVKDLSRFGRDYLETGNYIETIFPFMGVRFISVNDHFDTEQDYNENKSLEIALKNLVNDMYAKDISKRLVVTRKHEMERGKFTGSNAPYGYKVNESDPMRRFVMDEPAAAVVRKIFSMALEGKSIRKISIYLQNKNLSIPAQYLKTGHLYQEDGDEKKVWHIGTLSNILKNQAYIGNLVQGKRKKRLCDNEKRHFTDEDEWIICANAHEPIISRDIFYKVRALYEKKINESSFSSGRGKNISIRDNKYAGLIYCGNCGKKLEYLSAMVDKNCKVNRKYYFQCCNNFDASKEEVSCRVRITEDRLDDVAYGIIKKQVETFTDKKEIISKAENSLELAMQKFDEKIATLEDQIEKEEYAVSRQYEDYVMGKISLNEFVKVQDLSRQKIDIINEKISDVENDRIRRKKELEDKVGILKSMYRINGKKALDKSMLNTLINKIEIMPDSEIRIAFNFEDPFIDMVGDLGEPDCDRGGTLAKMDTVELGLEV